jgi:hypothetical protein
MRYRDVILEEGKKYIKDDFALETLKLPVEWTGFEISIGCFYLASIVLASVYHYRNPLTGATILFVSTLITVQFTMYIIVPKVNKHVQGSVVDFYKSHKGKDAYVETIGFKSYADLFYSDRKPGIWQGKDPEWYLNGPIDKDAYLVRKINRNEDMEMNDKLEKLGSKGGFVFYKREKAVGSGQ